jgi:hypothetical protein
MNMGTATIIMVPDWDKRALPTIGRELGPHRTKAKNAPRLIKTKAIGNPVTKNPIKAKNISSVIVMGSMQSPIQE